MNINYKELANLFTSNHLNELAKGNFSLIEHIQDTVFRSQKNITISDIFDQSFEILTENYPNEYIYKNMIIQKLFLTKYDFNKATILTEFRVGKRKADCVILNGKSTCYEIKTELDSLHRLSFQLEAYEKLFNEVYVVCSSKFTKKLLNDLEPHFGIIEFTPKMTLRKVRKSSIENATIDKNLMMQSLRQPEYKMLASTISNEDIIVPNTEIYDYCFKIIKNFKNEKKLNKIYIDTLKTKRKNDDKIIEKFPSSLINAAISYNFLKSDLEQLTNILNFQKGESENVLPNITRETT